MKKNFTSHSTTALGNLAEQTIALTEKNANKEAAGLPLFAILKESYSFYFTIIIKDTYSGLGKKVRDLDLKRDAYLLGLKDILKGHTRFEESAQGEDAQKLLKVIGNISATTTKTYAEETIIIEKMLENLSKEENKTLLENLQLLKHIDYLTNAQKEFDILYLEQIDANSQLRQQASASSVRKDLENALRDYYSYVEAMRTIDPWKDLYADLSELSEKMQ